MKKFRFYLHYNKPASQAAKKPLWSVHFRDKCHIVDKIICRPSTESKINKRQPFVVMRGHASLLRIIDNSCAILEK